MSAFVNLATAPLSRDVLANASFAVARPTFAKPLPAGETMRFSTLMQGGRPRIFTLHGHIATPIQSYQGAQLNFMMEPSWSLIDPLRSLELYPLAQIQGCEGISGYMLRPTLDQDNMLRVKLNINSSGDFKFTCSQRDFLPDTAVLVPGNPVRITVGAGIYFNETDLRYGVFYTLKHLDLSGDWLDTEPMQTTTLKQGISAK